MHGWDHMTPLVRSRRRMREEMRRTADLIELASGAAPRWYRPPFGVMSRTATLAAADVGLRPVLWTAWGRDWSSRATGPSVINAVRRQPARGGTILLHDADTASAPGSWRSTLEALPELLAGWRSEDLTVGPLRGHGGLFSLWAGP
ncbi:peptidoglycan N-acetylglucosamine deacetylase [Pseudonocardia sp. N23]|nr:peptidoglycan N-acetylglucosamine deacetylase [Pseudonocardia sp. N23]